MKNLRIAAVLAAGAILLAGCASSHADTAPQASTSPPPAGAMTPGMVMPGGSTMGANPASTSATTAGAPSAAALMICAEETRSDITKVLALKGEPTSQSSWANKIYTCRYHLPMGTFVLSVKESADPESAKTYTEALRTQTVGTKELAGLTETAFGTPDGVVVLLKDNDTLRVDATGLPAQFGDQKQKRADFAYEIASDILGCWTGDDS